MYYWITNIYDHTYSEKYEKIKQLIKNSSHDIIDNVTYIENKIVNGIYEIQLTFKEKNLDKETSSKIFQLINEMSLSPVSVSINSKYPLTTSELSGLSEIFIALIDKYYYNKAEKVEHTVYKNQNTYITYLRAYDNHGNGIYYDPKSEQNLIFKFNMMSVIGYRILSQDPLAEYEVKYQIKNNLLDPQSLDVLIVGGLVLAKNRTSINDNHPIIFDIRQSINNIKSKGYFIHNNVENYHYIQEISNLWPIKFIEKSSMGLVLKSKNDFVLQPSTWLQNSINLISTGSLPSYRFTSNWFDTNNYISKSTSISIPLIYYAVTICYFKLSRDYQELIPYLNKIKVHTDLTIEAFFATYDQYLLFYEIYSQYMKDNRDKLIYWKANNHNDALLKRWYIQKYFTYLVTLTFEINNQYYVVFESGQLDDLKFPENDKLVLTDQFLSEFVNISDKNIYQKLSDKINSLEPQYQCCKNEYPTTFHRKLDPQLGSKGYYTLGNIKGLYNDYQEPSKNINIGTINEYKINNLNLTEIDVDDKQLFITKKLSQKNFNDIKKLWKNGYFLNDWAWIVAKYSNIISETIVAYDDIF